MTPGPAIPDGIYISNEMSGLRIRRSWRSWKVVPLALFAAVWDSFLIFWYTSAFSKTGTPLIMILFPIGHLAAGIGITYFVISSILNSTDLEISASRVSVKTGPMPWFSDRDLATTEIRGLRLKYSYSNSNMPVFELRYRTAENREKKLIGGLNDDQAEYIEYQLRTILGLKEEEGNA